MENTKITAGRFFKWLLALAGGAALLSACASVQDLEQKVVKSTRSPGESLSATPEETAKTYSCKYTENTLYLELSEVLPERVKAGAEINHRIRIAFCPSVPSGTVQGTIVRRVLYKGRTMFADTAQYEFKPGTWTIDAFVAIPNKAPAGVYALEALISYQDKSLKKANAFVVKN